MAKPSVIAAGIVIVLCIGLIAMEAAGLGVFLSEFDDLDVSFVTAAQLVGAFAPFAGILILLLAIVTICVVLPIDPSQSGRVFLGCCWVFTAFVSAGCALLSILGFLIKSLVGIDCDDSIYEVVNNLHLKSECDDIVEIGKYMSIASAVVFAVITLLSICLCCFGCCCQEVDEPEREDTVTFVRVV